MRFILLLAIVFSLPVFSADYIIKLKSGVKADFNTKNGDFKKLNTSFADFMVYTPAKNADWKSLADHPAVEYIEPNRTYHVAPIVDMNEDTKSEPSFSKQWGLKNTGNNSGSLFVPGVAGRDINAEEAWPITKGSKEIKIAVIDTGVDYNHVDLKDNIWTNQAELNGEKGVDDDGNGYIDDIHGYDFANKDGDPMDDQGHGTHCAGVIGADHNGQGVAGVNSDVTIVALKFLKSNGSGTTEDAVLAIDYAIKAGVNIMSNSWGGGEFSQALEDTINAANEKGIIFVAAAGNSSSNNDTKPTYPACHKAENIISVGSMAGNGKRSSFSNYGAKSVHVYAPGSGIYSTIPKNRYKSMSGTSMACPFVAGVLGLMLTNEDMNVSQAKDRIITTSKPSSYLNTSVAKGWVDAHRALMNITE